MSQTAHNKTYNDAHKETHDTDPLRELAAHKRARRLRSAASVVFFLLITAFCYCVMLGQGSLQLSPLEVVEVLFGGGTRQAISVVWDLRLPLAIATVIVGAVLGMAGSWTQTMARNPLASPDFLGVSGGAAVLVVAGTVLTRPVWSEAIPTYWWRALLALVGATIIVIVLLMLGGLGSSQQVIIVGLALSFLTQALVYFLMQKAQLARAAEAQTWMAGSTGFVRTEALLPMVLGLLPFVLLGLTVARQIPLLAHDDATIATLGVEVQRVRTTILISATGLVAVVVSFVGPIGFIALVAPQVAKLVAKSPVPPAIGASAAGAAILTGCSVIAGWLPFTAPVGLVTAVIGGPALVWLVWSYSRAQGAGRGQ